MTAVTSITPELLTSGPGALNEALANVAAGPARELLVRSAADMLSLPGAQLVSWTSASPDSLKVQFSDEGFRLLGENVLRDAVDGVNLLLAIDPRVTPRTGDLPWHDNPTNMVRAVRSMPGVVESRLVGNTISFVTMSPDHQARIEPLLQPNFGPYDVRVIANGIYG